MDILEYPWEGISYWWIFIVEMGVTVPPGGTYFHDNLSYPWLWIIHQGDATHICSLAGGND